MKLEDIVHSGNKCFYNLQDTAEKRIWMAKNWKFLEKLLASVVFWANFQASKIPFRTKNKKFEKMIEN